MPACVRVCVRACVVLAMAAAQQVLTESASPACRQHAYITRPAKSHLPLCAKSHLPLCCCSAPAAGWRMLRRMVVRGTWWTLCCACCAPCQSSHLCWSSQVGASWPLFNGWHAFPACLVVPGLSIISWHAPFACLVVPGLSSLAGMPSLVAGCAWHAATTQSAVPVRFRLLSNVSSVKCVALLGAPSPRSICRPAGRAVWPLHHTP